ncbi:hypothetical protein GIB67_035461 [Kingdonia uniflora]|uniref:AB hydrolase-1 domain-containing protein n=1 Tax=Kingdonia uniflora TaxID=39325 RepID=A0A7J7P0D2_9MAGN|nr:hypothetical protein GIB67_035461 [Kingdonia uniflora]
MVVLKVSLKATMNARIIGNGEDTVILAHGFGGDQSIWEKILPSLTQRYRVLVFDWNFSGACKDSKAYDALKYSSLDVFANDLIDLVDELKLRDAILVGHSMSAMIGCLASIKRPDLFKKLVLVGGSPRYINCEGYEGGFEKSDVEQIFLNIETNFIAWASYFSTLVVDSNDPFSVEKFSKSLGRMRPEVALSVAKTIFCSDFRDCLDKVRVPCTIIQTTNDIVVPISVVQYMEKKIKGDVTVEIVEGDGHFPMLTNENLLLDVFDKVLKSDAY